MQHIFDTAIDDSVPGVIAALAANNDISPRSEHVDDLALALVPPLRPN